MRIGTRSVLYGAHAFYLHPWFVAWAWWKLYGFPWDPRLWAAFFLHDVGYVGKRNMDGPEEGGGEEHPIAGALVMDNLFGPEWGEFTLLHSRFFARRMGKPPSRLCVADKLAIVLTPAWLFLPMTAATGELAEYMNDTKYGDRPRDTPRVWITACKAAMAEWVEQHKGGGPGPNGCAVTEPPMARLPGYLDGGFEPGRYVITKASGEATDPRAKYLVVRYDQDPNAVVAALAYAVSVRGANPALADGIVASVRAVLGLDAATFAGRYGAFLAALARSLDVGPQTPEGITFAIETDPSGLALDCDGNPYPSDKHPPRPRS